jgi:flagellar motility protein MotE (MotC chaperone)
MYLKKDQLGYILHKMYPQQCNKITEFSLEKREKLDHLQQIFLSVLNDDLKFENFDFEKGDLFANS